MIETYQINQYYSISYNASGRYWLVTSQHGRCRAAALVSQRDAEKWSRVALEFGRPPITNRCVSEFENYMRSKNWRMTSYIPADHCYRWFDKNNDAGLTYDLDAIAAHWDVISENRTASSEAVFEKIKNLIWNGVDEAGFWYLCRHISAIVYIHETYGHQIDFTTFLKLYNEDVGSHKIRSKSDG